MLTQNQITEVEAVFFTINSYGVSTELYIDFTEHFYRINLYQFIYLKWLLQRWPLTRKRPNYLPKRILYIESELRYTH
jgi:hypothetical protein